MGPFSQLLLPLLLFSHSILAVNNKPQLYSATTWDNHLPIDHDNLLGVPRNAQGAFPTKWDDIRCATYHRCAAHYDPLSKPSTEDCKAAINLIPTGLLTIDPDPLHAGTRDRPNIHLPKHRRKFYLPAAFRSGTCVVSVSYSVRTYDIASQAPQAPPTLAADFLYFTVWPNAHRLALHILQKCPEGSGFVPFASCPDNKKCFGTFKFLVEVHWAHRAMGGNGSKFAISGGGLANVYE